MVRKSAICLNLFQPDEAIYAYASSSRSLSPHTHTHTHTHKHTHKHIHQASYTSLSHVLLSRSFQDICLSKYLLFQDPINIFKEYFDISLMEQMIHDAIFICECKIISMDRFTHLILHQ